MGVLGGGYGYNQKATYWANPVQGGFGGITFDAPIVLNVRWEDRTERFTDMAGQEQISRAVVYTDRDLDLGGYLVLDESVATDPTQVEGALYVQRSDEIPDLRGLNIEYRSFL